MTLYTSGDWKVDPNKDVTFPLVDWIVKLFPVIKDKEIEINQVDLDGEFAMGFCQDNDGEFLIHVHNGLDIKEYVKTLIHEFTHTLDRQLMVSQIQMPEKMKHTTSKSNLARHFGTIILVAHRM